MVSTRPPTSNSSRPFNNPLVTVPKSTTYDWYKRHPHVPQFFNSQARSRYLSFFSHSFSFILWSAGTANSTILHILFFFFFRLLLGLVFWLRLGDPCVCQSPIGVNVCHFPGQVLRCAYIICLYGQISISCTFRCGLPCPSNCVEFCTLSVIICCIRLLWDWSFRLWHHIAYICYFVES